ncbi:hypothetical protein ZIOFF_035795 [Zingiber officinale]|uniref:Uncharacterized protein n=1 Tax=Zingiber officinale TaxID=94328 RepID=A0A8J5GCD8_ZINOF|nr:hypothetical protein ZIOFF_035795 [Zingiber officinale]
MDFELSQVDTLASFFFVSPPLVLALCPVGCGACEAQLGSEMARRVALSTREKWKEEKGRRNRAGRCDEEMNPLFKGDDDGEKSRERKLRRRQQLGSREARFRIEAHDNGCRTQYSGVCVIGDIGNASAYKSIGGNASAYKSIGGIRRLQVEEQKAQYIGNQGRIGGISTHTLIVHFEEDEWKERDFTEDSSFLDILNICKKFIDIYSVGFKVTDADGKLLRNDKDLLAMLKAHEDVENIEIYLDVDETAQPLHFKMPQDNPSFGRDNKEVPKVRDVTILSDFKTNEKVKVRGDVDEIVKTIQSTTSLSHIEVVEKCFGPQRHSHIFGFRGGMKRKHFNCSQATYIKDLEAKLHEKEEENNNLKKCMDGIESRLAKIENKNQPTSDEPAIDGEGDTLYQISAKF